MNSLLPKNIRKLIELIQMDNASGSVELAKKSAEVLILLTKKTNSLTQINIAMNLLVNAQPNMASIINLVNNLMINIDRNKIKLPKNIIHTYCKKFLQELESSDKLISKQTNKFIKNNATIITHSYSSTVLNALLFAKKFGKKFSVICTESRPKNEGVTLAKQLGKNKINVKLIVDSALFSYIQNADIILVGGDAVTFNGLVNKIGTKGLAITAQHYKIPTYALCSTIKFLPKTYPLALNYQKNPTEILQKKISNVTPINYYFDLTPLEFLSGIITENEILKPKEIIEKIKHLKIHNSLEIT
jgi:translation initiation factor 2B subunit (eIF-2B alpha/beta/delta family)